VQAHADPMKVLTGRHERGEGTRERLDLPGYRSLPACEVGLHLLSARKGSLDFPRCR